MANNPWTEAETAIVIKYAGQEGDVGVARRLTRAGYSRSPAAVQLRRFTLGISKAQTSRWTDERVEEIKRLDKLGHSASQIAKALGAGFTRSSIIGKLHRLGVTDPNRAKTRMLASEINRRATPRKAPASVSSVRSFQHGGGCPSTGAAAPSSVKITGPVAGSLNLPILHPLFRGCRWPTVVDDDGIQRFCCIPSKGEIYCADHRAAAYGERGPESPKDAAELIRALRRYA